MGAETFFNKAKGKTPDEAFRAAREQALYDHGHSGYSGSIAEKRDFTVVVPPAGADPQRYADELIEAGDERVDDKWGPAGCVSLGDDTYLFFGWASS